MFKWACLAVAVLFLSVALWMLNDIRLQVHRGARVIDDAGETVSTELPEIIQSSRVTSETVARNLPEVVAKVRAGTDTLSKSLPRVVERIDRTSEIVAELAEDIRQLKELAGLKAVPRDRNVVVYAESVLQKIASSGGVIGLKKNLGKGLKNPQPATDWVEAERREAALMAVLGRSKKQMLQAIVKSKLGFSWFIQLPGQKPVKLLDWLRENHEETRGLG